MLFQSHLALLYATLLQCSTISDGDEVIISQTHVATAHAIEAWAKLSSIAKKT